VRVWLCGDKKLILDELIFMKLILTKNELNVNEFMFGHIDVNVR